RQPPRPPRPRCRCLHLPSARARSTRSYLCRGGWWPASASSGGLAVAGAGPAGSRNRDGSGALMLADASSGAVPGERAWRRWRRGDPASLTVGMRTAAVIGLVVAVYHTSLWSLVRGITVDTPLAYVGLVPIIGVG